MMRQHVLAAAATLAVVVPLGSLAEAQQLVDSDKLDQYKSPELPELPYDAEAQILAYVRNTPAVMFDPDLPPIEIEQWLVATLLPKIEHLSPQLSEWKQNWCEDRTSDIPDQGPELCVEALIPVSDEKSVSIIFSVADWGPTPSGSQTWLVHPPVVRDISIGGRRNSLNVASLQDLEDAIDRPVEEWPTVDLKVALDPTPIRALPGDVVSFRVQVSNVGNRDAERAAIHITITPCCENDARRYLWHPRIPAGYVATVEIPVALPEGRALAMVSAHVDETFKRIEERSTHDHFVTVWVHHVDDPPYLTPTPPTTNPATKRPNP
jgi:hypothetical protein